MTWSMGLDYGTNSVRCVIVRTADGAVTGQAVVNYPSGEQGILLDARDHHLARQAVGDYISSLQQVVCRSIEKRQKSR